MPSMEVLAVLADEVAEASGRMAAAMATLSESNDKESRCEAIDGYLEQVQRIGSVAQALAMKGLEQVCFHVKANLIALDEKAPEPELRELFEQWPQRVLKYLAAPRDTHACQALAQCLAAARWPAPVTLEDRLCLEQLLGEVDETSDEETKNSRPDKASPEDVSLAIPPDVNPALIEAFLTEGPLQATHYSTTIQRVIRGEENVEGINEARRVVHALKGAANTVRARGVATLTHQVEDILEYLAEKAVKPEGSLAKLLIEVADCLEMMFESLVDGVPPPAQARDILQQLLDWANRMDRQEFDMQVEPVRSELPVTTTPSDLKTIPIDGKAAPTTKTAATANVSAVDPKVRVSITAIDEMLRMSGELTISRGHIQERLQEAVKLANDLRDNNNLLWNRSGELETIVTVQGIAAGQKQQAALRGGAASSAVFDALELDQYSELHGSVHGFVETVSDLQMLGNRILDALSAIETSLEQQGLINSELHELMMRSRMVSVSVIEPRLGRTVRQICDATGKLAQLDFRDGDVMLDDRIIGDLTDPLLHMIRNAIDHGVERPEIRAQSGKPEVGTISIRFARVGNHITITLEDDGAGLDLHQIHRTAVERGLVLEGQKLDKSEIARLILLPGFSTSKKLSEISGRGVGMDIVNTGMRKLKGSIDIQTEESVGCKFTLRIPMTLGTAHCLMVETGGQTAAIPSDSLERAVFSGARNIQRIGVKWAYRDEIDTCDVIDLAVLLGQPEMRPLGDPHDTRPVLLMKDESGRKAIVVDSLLVGRDLVIKNPGKYLSNIVGVVGVSLLGDGRIAPVLDLAELLRAAEHVKDNVLSIVPSVRKGPDEQRDSIDVLVVDDSLSVRLALTQLLTSEGYNVRTAKDGVEALEQLEKETPAAVLLDLEMPRMNGLELTANLRNRKATANLPVIMITSRSSEKHRAQAMLSGVSLYVTKPYRESDLLLHLQNMLSKAA